MDRGTLAKTENAQHKTANLCHKTALRIGEMAVRDLPDAPTVAPAPVGTPTLDEVRSWPATVDVTDAARALGISRSKLYALIQRDQAPVRVLNVGSKRVITASLVRLLEAA